jgi:hypothetical protein
MQKRERKKKAVVVSMWMMMICLRGSKSVDMSTKHTLTHHTQNEEGEQKSNRADVVGFVDIYAFVRPRRVVYM